MKHVVKVDRYGQQVRVCIPKALVEATAFKSAAYALIWKGADGFLCIHPFIDRDMLNAAISRDRNVQDPPAGSPGPDGD